MKKMSIATILLTNIKALFMSNQVEQKQPQEPKWMTVTQFAQAIGVSPVAVRQKAYSGKIETVIIPDISTDKLIDYNRYKHLIIRKYNRKKSGGQQG